MKRETLLVHQNFRGDEHNSVVRQINTTTAFHFDDADHAAALFNLEAGGNIYSRITGPNADALAQLVSDLEGGIGGLSVSSGQAAITTAILTIAQAGDNILVSNSLYGGSISLINNTLKAIGIKPTFFNQDDSYEEIASIIKEDTKLVLVEVIANPNCDVIDFEKIKRLSNEYDFPIIVDSTFTPPTLFRPLEWGAHIVVHSATKYLGGHGNSLGGIIVDSGKFAWNNPKYACLNQPDNGYHGLIYNQHFKEAAFIARAKTQILRDMGSALSPFNAYLITTGIQTLALRTQFISKNTLLIAKYLEAHPKVQSVSYPLLPSHKDYELAKKYFVDGASGILSFRLKGGLEEGQHFLNNIKVGINAVNVGDVRTIVSHPASTTHRQLTPEQLENSGIRDNQIRISVGLEAVEDLIADFEQAFK